MSINFNSLIIYITIVYIILKTFIKFLYSKNKKILYRLIKLYKIVSKIDLNIWLVNFIF